MFLFSNDVVSRNQCSYLWEMYQFFNSQIKSLCVLIIVVSMCIIHAPDFSSKSDYESFNSWIKTQVADDLSDFDANSLPAHRFGSNAEFIKQVKKLIGNTGLDTEDPLDRDVVRYLYLTWTKFYSASDMAGTLALERIKPLSFINQPFNLSGLAGLINQRIGFPVVALYSKEWKQSTPFYAYLIEPAASGISTHAP